MKNYYLIIFALFLLNLSCSTQETDNTPVTIVGNWKVTEMQYSDSVDYSLAGCELEIELEFRENLTATANEPNDDIEDGVCIDQYYNFEYILTEQNLTIIQNNIQTEYNYELTSTTLKYWRTNSNNNITSTKSWERID
jgi:hypothetical protein